MQQDEYTTISGTSAAELKVLGSQFLARAYPIRTKEEAGQFLETLRKEFWDATHHCYAYRLGTDRTSFRANDDGEPKGSAGKPILAALDKFGFTDVLLVVVRYFGGTKLGVGGLVRAYGQAAEAALANATPLRRYITAAVDVDFPHSQISGVMHVISKTDAKILDTTYDEEVHARLEIRHSRIDELTSSLVNQTKGNIAIRRLKQE